MSWFDDHQGAYPSYIKTELTLARIFGDYLIGQIFKWSIVLQGHSGGEQGQPGDETRNHAIIIRLSVLS